MGKTSNQDTPQLLNLHLYGDKVLAQIAQPVKEINEAVRTLIHNMKHTMYTADGLGLAAPQVGASLRIFMIDINFSETGKKKPLVFINPEFTLHEGEETFEEGCLSVPGIFCEVKRAGLVSIKALDEKGKEFSLNNIEGIYADALQHEYDHLDGKVFIDRVSKIKKMMVKRKINEITRQTDAAGNNIKVI